MLHKRSELKEIEDEFRLKPVLSEIEKRTFAQRLEAFIEDVQLLMLCKRDCVDEIEWVFQAQNLANEFGIELQGQ